MLAIRAARRRGRTADAVRAFDFFRWSRHAPQLAAIGLAQAERDQFFIRQTGERDLVSPETGR